MALTTDLHEILVGGVYGEVVMYNLKSGAGQVYEGSQSCFTSKPEPDFDWSRIEKLRGKGPINRKVADPTINSKKSHPGPGNHQGK